MKSLLERFNDAKVIALRLLAKAGLQYKVLGPMFGISPEAASMAANGVTWSHVREVLDAPSIPSA